MVFVHSIWLALIDVEQRDEVPVIVVTFLHQRIVVLLGSFKRFETTQKFVVLISRFVVNTFNTYTERLRSGSPR